MKNIKTLLFLLILILSSGKAFSEAPDDLEILRKRFINELLEPNVNENSIKNLLSTIREDGTWPDINYTDVSKTGFQHGKHLNNMVEMARAYVKKGSKYKGDAKLKKAIYSAINYWLANNFICENWWWNQIGTPNALVGFLLIMDKNLPPVQIEKALPIVGRANLDASGARPSGDRIKIAGIFAKRALFTRNKEEFEKTIRVIEGEIKFSTGRGMQYDYSFHHRLDWVNNTLSYGLGYADAFAEWAANVAGTQYKFSEKPMHLLIDYYLDGICKQMIYGKYPDPGAMNRDITRADANRAFGIATPERLMKATDYRKKELEDIIKIREGLERPALSHCTFYWNSDHFTFQRPGFFTSVRMYSSRIHNMEEPYNGEGLMNHHRGDGTNYISRTGKEYFDISPVYDWQRIPGATILQKPSLPAENEIQKEGLTDFVGAVTNGMYGAATFDFRSPHDPLKVKKAWFFFDKEYVCLGTGISSASNLPVNTTLNQCLLNGDVRIMKGSQEAVLPKGVSTKDNVSWVLHDSIGYYFPAPVPVNVSNQTESGSWFKINHQSDSPKEEIKLDVFKLWLDHGKRPDSASYQYIVIPGIGEDEMKSYPRQCAVQVLSNTSELQAVKHSGLNIYEAVFYTSGELQLTDKLRVGIESPGIVMLKMDGNELKQITVADPTHKLSKLHLWISAKTGKGDDTFTSVWNENQGISEVTIPLPQTVYAGKSITINL